MSTYLKSRKSLTPEEIALFEAEANVTRKRVSDAVDREETKKHQKLCKKNGGHHFKDSVCVVCSIDYTAHWTSY